MALSVLLTVELPLFRADSPHRHHLLLQNVILIPHILAGLAALLIGPVQFSTRMRQRNLGLHRVLGKVYVLAIVVAACTAFLLGNNIPRPVMIASNSQAVLWLLCTTAAFLTARNRHIAQHRVWMIRSYSVTLIFFTSRVLNPIPFFGNMDPVTFACFLLILQLSALLVPEIGLHWTALTTRRK